MPPPSFLFWPPTRGTPSSENCIHVPPLLKLHPRRCSPQKLQTGMPIPTIVRLSQALYSDVPSPAPARSCRKRNHANSDTTSVTAAAESAEETPPAVFRLLLPRTFAVADRAYHDSLITEGYAKGTGRKAGATGAACRDGDAASEVAPQLDIAGGTREEEHDGCSSDSDSGSRQRQPPCSVRLAAQGGAVLLVVESVLGFSEVCGLLDRSHAALTKAAGDREEGVRPRPGDPDFLCTCNGEDSATNDGDQSAVSVAVGRLVGWLRIAAARSNLSDHGSSGSVVTTSRPKLEPGNARTESAGVATSFDLDLGGDDLLLAVAGGRAYDTPYGVSGQCERAAGWKAFDLEAKEARASGEDTEPTAA